MAEEIQKAEEEETGETPENVEMDEIQNLQREIDQLKKELEEEKERSREYLDLAKRIQADFDNYKKRVKKEIDQAIECANEKILYDILGIIDDFERAMSSLDRINEFTDGVKKIYSNLLSLISHYGVREITDNEFFNPEFHEALCTGDGEEGRILEVFQKGYLLGNRVLRCSKVKVGKCKEEGDGND